MENNAVIVFNMLSRNKKVNLDVPLDMTANELVLALNEAYDLRIDTSDIKNCFLRSENPIALLKGYRTLREFGIINGSEVLFLDN